MSGARTAEEDAGQGPLSDQVIDLGALERKLPELRARYRSASPFPHIAMDG